MIRVCVCGYGWIWMDTDGYGCYGWIWMDMDAYVCIWMIWMDMDGYGWIWIHKQIWTRKPLDINTTHTTIHYNTRQYKAIHTIQIQYKYKYKYTTRQYNDNTHDTNTIQYNTNTLLHYNTRQYKATHTI